MRPTIRDLSMLAVGMTLFATVWLAVMGAMAAPPPDTNQEPTTIASQSAQANAINYNTIILAFFGLVTSLATTFAGVYLVKIKSSQDGLTKVTNDTHTLVNSNMGVQLKLNAAITQRMSNLTHEPDDIAAAAIAKLAYEEHVKRQAMVDSGGGQQ